MDISGTWYNELKSHMILEVNGRSIRGTYRTRVGAAWGEYQLTGQVDNDNDQSAAIGWVVVWNNDQYGSSDSVTAWSGQVQVDKESGIEKMVTTWLLTCETDEDDNWHSTIVGKDVFTRIEPSNEVINENLLKGVKSSNPKIQ
jgi:hypothetical protein